MMWSLWPESSQGNLLCPSALHQPRRAPPRLLEADHISGETDIVGVAKELVIEELRRADTGEPETFVRPDHGHQILDDNNRVTRPGYPLIGRLKRMSELRGVEAAFRMADLGSEPTIRSTTRV